MIVALRPFPILFYIFLIAVFIYLILKPYRYGWEKFRLWLEIKNENVIGVLIALVCVVIAMSATTSGHNYGDDFIAYISQAMALSHGTVDTWYENNSWIIQHSISGLGPEVYPWGFPLLLIPFYNLFGVHFFAFKCFIGFCFGLAVFFLYKIYAAHLSKGWSAVLVLLSGLNRAINKAVDEVTSNIPSLAFTFIAIYIIDRYVRLGKRNYKNAVLIGLLSFFLVELRQANVTVLVALFIVDLCYLYDLLKRRKELTRKQLRTEIMVGITPYVIFLLGYILFKFLFLSSGNTYGSYYDFSFSFIFNNLIYYYMTLGVYLCDFFQAYPTSRIVVHILSLFAIGAVFVGVGKRWKKDRYIILFVLINIMMLLPFEGYLASAYMYPIFPLCVLLGFYGCESIAKKIGKPVFTLSLKAIVSALLISLCIYDGYVAYEVQSGAYPLNEAFSSEAKETYAFINEHIPDDAMIEFFKPRLLYFTTNNKSYSCYVNEDDLKMADYILVSNAQNDANEMNEYAKNHQYEMIFENQVFILWEKPA